MFNKLKNRFLILNLIIISVMMIVSFTSIYLITYKNVRFGIDVNLHEIEEFYSKHEDVEDMPIYAEHSVSFCIETDKHWNTLTKLSPFKIDNNLCENIKNAASLQNNNMGDFTLEGKHWSFIIAPIIDGYRIIFLDTTSQQKILTSLICAFMIVAFITFIFIYFISRFFANQSIKPVKEAFDKQKQFIADASHELKTPVAVISTNVDVLLSNSEDIINNQTKWLNYIKAESEKMAKLTNDLLYLAQIDCFEIKTFYKKFNLSTAVEYVILTMEAVIYENHILLDYDIEPGLITFGSDEQIRRVVMILIDNAIKYTNSNGSISISLTKRNEDFVLSIANTGDGIPKEHLGKIFDRFYRTDKSHSRKFGEGHGLGLSIAKAIIDQHKGKIHVESILNQSTTFFISLH